MMSCNNSSSKESVVVKSPEQMDKKASENIKASLEQALNNNGKINDSIKLQFASVLNSFYKDADFEVLWSHKEKWEPLTDSLYGFIEHAELEGLFPKDYHFDELKNLKHSLDNDSLKRMNAVLWSHSDLMLTDGLIHIMKDLKHGRLQHDSVNVGSDSSLTDSFFIQRLKELKEKKDFTGILNSLQPKFKAYWELKKGIKSFVDSMDRRTYTYVPYPYKNSDDSLKFVKTLQARLQESGCVEATNKRVDSAQLKAAVIKFQKQKGVTADGKINTAFIRTINTSDAERFKRIAITLDRYKLLPEKMPERYIWVNLPSYYLQVWDNDTLVMESKTIVGKPATRTPLLNSYITNMITYPTWTLPTSIIAKDVLPGMKRNRGYLAKKGFKLLNSKGESVDPASLDWSKYKKGIPYRVQQGSGDDNALGIFKFNFNNPYAVYLHDTNQRYLFKNASRAISHGCVRVQEWQSLANYIARTDSISAKPNGQLAYTTDSIRSWIASKKHRQMEVKSKIAVYLRYFSCEGKNGKIKFYDDIYGEDKILREKYFADK
ncbi:MAG: L,D-transpeptidase family protein [Ferruginibacter sp.]